MNSLASFFTPEFRLARGLRHPHPHPSPQRTTGRISGQAADLSPSESAAYFVWLQQGKLERRQTRLV